mgnify:CR=1 FL=1
MIISALITKIIIGFSISAIMAGASYAYRKFTQKPLEIGERDFEVNVVDTKSYLPVVRGRMLLGINRIYTNVHPSDKSLLYLVGAICHGPIQSIQKIYFDGDIAVDYVNNPADDPVDSFYSDVIQEVDYRLGGINQAAYAEMKTAFPNIWTDNHKGDGVASIMLKIKFNADKFPSGLPNKITVLVKGSKLQDFRQDLILDACETAWTSQQTDLNPDQVTVATTTGKVANAVRATILASASSGLLFTKEMSAKDVSGLNALTLWIRSSIDIAVAELKILIDEHANCASPERTLSLPALFANEWKRVVVEYSTDVITDLNAIISIGIKQNSDLGAFTLDIDEVYATLLCYDYLSAKNMPLIEDCEDVWLETTANSANITRSTSTDIPSNLTGNSATAKIVNPTSVAANTILMTEAISIDLSAAEYISVYIKSSIDLDYGDLAILLDNTAQCASPLETLKIPKLKAKDGWQYIELELKDPSLLTTIISVGLKQRKQLGVNADGIKTTEPIFYLDQIQALNYVEPGANPILSQFDYLSNPVYGGAFEPENDFDLPAFTIEANYCDELVAGLPLEPPEACKAKLLEETGNLSLGDYRYRITFVFSDGTETAGSQRSNKVTTKNKKKSDGNTAPYTKIRLKNIPISDAFQVVARNIYRTQANGTEYRLLDTINDNILTSYDDSIADATIASAATCPESNVGASAVSQPRFECHGIVDTSKEIKNNIEELLTSCRGNLFFESGKYSVFIKKPTTSETTIALTEDNIIGDWDFSLPGVRDTANIIKASWINKPKDYKTSYVFWPPKKEDNPYLINDNEFENIREMDLFFTINKQTARQLSMVAWREPRLAPIKVNVKCKEEALKLRVGSVVNVTHTTPDWTTKAFWVEGIGILMNGQIQISLGEYNVNSYSYDTINADPVPYQAIDDTVGDLLEPPDMIEYPPPVTGLEGIYKRGNDGDVFGRDLAIRWNGVTIAGNNTEYLISAKPPSNDYVSPTTYSEQGIKYKIEVYYSIFQYLNPQVYIGIVNVKDRIVFVKVQPETEFVFSLEDNIEAAKTLWENQATNDPTNYAKYYGVPQRNVMFWVYTINEKGNISTPKEIILGNDAPDMLNSAGVNTTPTVTVLKSALEFDFPHPYQEYDISHFIGKLASGGLDVLQSSAAWIASTAYSSLTHYVYPTKLNGHAYKCTTSGTSGTSEPTWTEPTSAIQHPTVNDGTVVWTHIGTLKIQKIASIINADSSDTEVLAANYTVKVKGLDPKTIYYFKVTPYDVYGVGSPSLPSPPTQPGLTEDDSESYITIPAATTGLALTVEVGTNLKAKWNQNAESDIDGYILMLRGVNDITAAIQPTAQEIADGVTAGGKDTTGDVYWIGVDGDVGSVNQYIFKDMKNGWKYFVRVRAVNTSDQKGYWSHADDGIVVWPSNASVLGISSDDFDYTYKRFIFTTVFSSTDADTVAWTAGLLQFRKFDGTTENHSIGSGNTGNMTGSGGWIIWQSSAPTVYSYVTSIGEGQVAMARVKPDTNQAFYGVFADTKESVLSRSMLLANTILGQHIEADTLSAIKANLGALTLAHSDGASIAWKDNSGVIRMWMAVTNAGVPIIRISKATYNASTETNPNNLLFSSAYNYVKVINSEEHILNSSTIFIAATVNANAFGFQSESFDVSSTVPDTSNRKIKGTINLGGGFVFPTTYISLLRIDATGLVWGWWEIYYDPGNRKVWVRRYVMNDSTVNYSLGSAVNHYASWEIDAETLT